MRQVPTTPTESSPLTLAAWFPNHSIRMTLAVYPGINPLMNAPACTSSRVATIYLVQSR